MADAPAEKKKNSYKVANSYETTSDGTKRKNSDCPKCGQGFRMAQHKNRKSCGKCGYTEFQ